MIKFVYFFIFLFFTCSYAGDSKVIFNDNSSVLKNFSLGYYSDTSMNLNLENIKKVDSFEKINSKFSLGYIKTTLWIKIDFENKSKNEDFIISLNEHFYEKANLYYFDEKINDYKKVENSLFTLLDKREIQSPKLSFIFNAKTNSSQVLYLELGGKYPFFGDIEIYKQDYLFQNKLLSIESFYLFMFGALTIIILFNLFLYISLKEIIYFYYVCYALCVSAYLLNISGMLAYLNMQDLIYKTYFLAAFSIVFFAFFSLEYLNAKKNFPKIIPVIKTLSFILVILGIISIFQYTPFNKYLNYFILITLIVLIVTSIVVYNKRYKRARLYLFAILLYFISIITFLLLLTGVLENTNITRYGYLFSLSFEIMLFSLMLAGRYNDIKNEQIKTQKEFISLRINQNKMLEEEVARQTARLNKTNLELSTSLRERELLLKEVFHRVKNNFHMILGMLWFESKKHKEEGIFAELNNRINTMSKIHEHLLYSSTNLHNIQIDEYLKDLLSSIEVLYTNRNFSLSYEVEDICLQFEEALSLGVIINEIINNSIKYGKNLKNNNISLNLKKEHGIISLLIKDTGEGFSKDYEKGLGLNLVDEFSEKLDNPEHKFFFENGLVYSLKFTQRDSNDK